MKNHNGIRFMTFDSDHDADSENCAKVFKGAWWYFHCHLANLNGMYLGGHHTSLGDGIEWITWHGDYYSLKSSKMMIAKH